MAAIAPGSPPWTARRSNTATDSVQSAQLFYFEGNIIFTIAYVFFLCVHFPFIYNLYVCNTDKYTNNLAHAIRFAIVGIRFEIRSLVDECLAINRDPFQLWVTIWDSFLVVEFLQRSIGIQSSLEWRFEIRSLVDECLEQWSKNTGHDKFSPQPKKLRCRKYTLRWHYFHRWICLRFHCSGSF